MPYYPEITVINSFAAVERERRLPPNAISDGAQVVVNEPVDAVQPVLMGDVMGNYRILDIVKALRLKNPTQEEIDDTLLIEVGMRAQLGQEIARKGRGRRGKVLISPIDGMVVAIDGSRVILQESMQAVEVKAKLPGDVTAIAPNSVTLRGKGVLIQCAWGNGPFVFRAYKFLPQDGFAALSKMDPRISEYRNAVIICQTPLNAGDLQVAEQQSVAGLVAPSLSASLRELALQLSFPVLLTEGFGQQRPTELIYRLLKDNMGLQAVFDATIPDRWNDNRPEIIIPLPAKGQVPMQVMLDHALEQDMQVRITRAPWESMIGVIEKLPQTPQVIDNGLRVPCASVRFADGNCALVPLANLELLG